MEFPKRILVPIDLSDCSLAGLAYAAFVGEHYGATVHVLYVREGDAGATPDEAAEGELGVHPSVVDRVKAFLADIGSPLCYEIKVIVSKGDAADAIIRFAAAGHYDHLVMGNWGIDHASGAASHLHIPTAALAAGEQRGHVARRVAGAAPCPVTFVEASEAEPPIKRLGFSLRPAEKHPTEGQHFFFDPTGSGSGSGATAQRCD